MLAYQLNIIRMAMNYEESLIRASPSNRLEMCNELLVELEQLATETLLRAEVEVSK